MNVLKSIGAVIAGLFTGALLSLITDYIMASLGMMMLDNFKETPFWVVVIVILYRFVFNVAGCYVTGRVAPSKPVLHIWILGIVGFLMALSGTVVMWDQAFPFYNIAIIAIALPSAWLAQKLYRKYHSI